MRALPFILLLLALAHGAPAKDSEEVVGPWSAQHQNLTARFAVRFHTFALTNIPTLSLSLEPGERYSEFLVYLELKNTSAVLSTMVLDLDLDPATNLVYRVTDAKGQPVQPEVAFRSTFDPGTYHLVLPPDSYLRFPISRNGAGVSEYKTKLDVGRQKGTWYFDARTGQEYQLSGTLEVPRQEGRYGPMWWQGRLEIPPVKLIIPGPAAEPDGASNRSQPVRPETNSTSGAAGSRR
jgi:hypothetical protein